MPLTEKQNFMKVINGETPDWVPRYFMGADPFATKPQQCVSLRCSVVPNRPAGDDSGISHIDVFGVEYVATKETGWQSLPKPGVFIMDDVTKWRDIVKLPDLSDVDWDAVCKRDLANMTVNPDDAAVIFGGIGNGFFMPLMNMMGFTNGLVAMYEEPEAVMEMYDYMADWYCKGLENTIDRYPIDILSIGDDTATATNPFISPAMYRELIKPYLSRVTKYAQDRGIPIMMHDCGRCEDFIEDWRDLGVNSWNPAQVVNDLDGIKKKYGNELVLIGCWDSQGPAGWPHAPEEVVRQAVRDTIDRYATGGGFMFWGSVYGDPDDPSVDDKRRWMTDEYEKYRANPYK